MRIFAFIVGCLLLVSQAMGRTITVGAWEGQAGDFRRIQDAIDQSRDGDIILVRPNRYYENINFYGKAITITSLDPDDPDCVASTVIRGENTDIPTIQFDSGEGNDSVLTGVTVKSLDRQAPDRHGAAIYCYYSDPTIKDCTITDAEWAVRGHEANPLLIRSHIYGCDSGPYGRNSAIRNCGGEIRSCTISDNENDGLQDTYAYVVNCLIVNNGGSGVNGGSGSVINCTIANNEGSGISTSGEIRNCIIVGNGGYGIGGGTLISFNNVWGNFFGSYGGSSPSSKDIHENPQFASTNNFRLESEAGRWDQLTGQWVMDSVTSPCIDAGDPNDSVETELNPNGGRINMGAYGGTSEASKSPGGIVVPVCRQYPVADFNKDCRVDFADFAFFASEWLACNYDPVTMCE